MKHVQLLTVAFVGASLFACGDPGPFYEAQTLGGKSIDAATLNRGYEKYMNNCYACHGENGDGNGPASHYLRPPPRDFRSGLFKFGGVAAGDLPHDKDIVALVRRGLNGTAMLPWDTTEEDLYDIVQFIKTFSERWKDEEAGERVMATEDPWAGKEAEAIKHGEKVYHMTAKCSLCHPTYIDKNELYQYNKDAGVELDEISDEIYRPNTRKSQYQRGDHTLSILPIDFLFHPVKNGTKKQELYRSIAAGIGGTAMPMWKGALEEEDLWGLVHYVKGVIDMRDTPKGQALRAKLDGQGAFVKPGADSKAKPTGKPAQ